MRIIIQIKQASFMLNKLLNTHMFKSFKIINLFRTKLRMIGNRRILALSFPMFPITILLQLNLNRLQNFRHYLLRSINLFILASRLSIILTGSPNLLFLTSLKSFTFALSNTTLTLTSNMALYTPNRNILPTSSSMKMSIFLICRRSYLSRCFAFPFSKS